MESLLIGVLGRSHDEEIKKIRREGASREGTWCVVGRSTSIIDTCLRSIRIGVAVGSALITQPHALATV